MALKKRDISYIFILSIINLCIGSEINRDETRLSSKHDFDLLIFTQRWPITDCMTWMNSGEDHVCVLPSQRDTWIIHGVWPTKYHTMGPFFCNDSAPFDINSLHPLMDQLEQYWLNIRKGTPEASLWQHEWLKHGTCASVIEDLRTENKYFGQGLTWLQQFTMNNILSKANIKPGSQFNVHDYYNAITDALKVKPVLHCVREKHHAGEQYLSEIRICFNKQLELIDCTGVVGKPFKKFEYYDDYDIITNNGYYDDDIIANCDLNSKVNYPSTLPKYLIENNDRKPDAPVWRFPWVNLYKLVRMIKWLTL